MSEKDRATEKAQPAAQNVPSQMITVRSCWASLINGECLVESGDDYRLADRVMWQQAMVYEMPKSEFNKLPKPEQFDFDKEFAAKVWRSGVVRKNNFPQNALAAVSQRNGKSHIETLKKIRG